MIVLMGVTMSLEQQFRDIQAEAGEPNWDGNGSPPVKSKTIHHAKEFVESLPTEFQTLDISPEVDGHVCLEWYRDRWWMLSISVDADGRLHWGALLGKKSMYGCHEFTGESPDSLIDILRKLNDRREE